METTTIEISKETHKRLREYASKEGFLISRLGDKILRAFLDKKEGEGSVKEGSS